MGYQLKFKLMDMNTFCCDDYIFEILWERLSLESVFKNLKIENSVKSLCCNDSFHYHIIFHTYFTCRQTFFCGLFLKRTWTFKTLQSVYDYQTPSFCFWDSLISQHKYALLALSRCFI